MLAKGRLVTAGQQGTSVVCQAVLPLGSSKVEGSRFCPEKSALQNMEERPAGCDRLRLGPAAGLTSASRASLCTISRQASSQDISSELPQTWCRVKDAREAKHRPDAASAKQALPGVSTSGLPNNGSGTSPTGELAEVFWPLAATPDAWRLHMTNCRVHADARFETVP